MIESPCYNPSRDNEIVYPGLSIDLDAALRSGIVKDLGTEVEYNGIDDPKMIRKRVSDTFEAIDERNSVVHKELRRVKSETKDDSVSASSDLADLPLS